MQVSKKVVYTLTREEVEEAIRVYISEEESDYVGGGTVRFLNDFGMNEIGDFICTYDTLNEWGDGVNTTI